MGAIVKITGKKVKFLIFLSSLVFIISGCSKQDSKKADINKDTYKINRKCY